MSAITIIVPVYNSEEYLCRCIDSILAQSFKDFEVILIDDGSTDNSGAICDNYSNIDARIKTFHISNNGVSNARNYALSKACSDYVSFIDSDDWISPLFIEKMYTGIKKANADICISPVTRTNEKSVSSVQPISGFDICTGRESISLLGKANDERFRSVLSKVIKKSIALSCPFPIDRKWSEDTAVVYKWLYRSSTVVLLQDRLYYYYDNPNGTTAKIDAISRLGIIDTYEEMLSFLEKNGYEELKQLFIRLYAENLAYLYFSINKLPCAYQIRRTLKLKMYRLLLGKNTRWYFSIKKDPYCFEVIMPFFMRAYWAYHTSKQKKK